MTATKTTDPRLTLITARVSWTRTTPGGGKQKVVRDLSFRIDGRDGGWMVDRWTMPWETIHGSKPFATKREAMAYLRAYIRAVKDQQVLDSHPRMGDTEQAAMAA